MQRKFFRKSRVQAFCLIWMLCACTHPRKASELPAEYFYRNAALSYFKISPDGHLLSYLKVENRHLNLYLRDLRTKQEKALTRLDAGNISRYTWVSNSKIIFLNAPDGDDHFHLFAISVGSETPVDLTPFSGVKVDWLDVSNFPSSSFYFGMNHRKADLIDVYRLDTRTDSIRVELNNPGHLQFIQLRADTSGLLRSYIRTDGENQTLMYRPSANDTFQTVLKTDFRDRVEPLAFAADRQSMYVSSNLGRNCLAIARLDSRTGKELEVLYADSLYDTRELTMDAETGRPLFATTYTWHREDHVLDAKLSAWFLRICQQFKGEDVQIADADIAGKKYVIRVLSEKNPGSCYLYNKADSKLIKLADLSPWIETDLMSETRPLDFTARDGMRIHAYLTLPKGLPPRKLRLIVMVHPGPYDRDRWVYNRELQFLASRGFAILQVNYRGSTGFGRKYWEASFKQWGLAMEDDLEDGVHELVRKGIADGARVGIYGAGFGGYCALVGASRRNSLFSCALSFSGFSNVFSYLQDIPPQYKAQQQMNMQTAGNPSTEIARLKRISPIFQTESTRVPVFLVQGDHYTRTSLSETLHYAGLLRKKGAGPQLLIKAGEGYAFTKDQDKADFYNSMEIYFEKHLSKH